MFEHPTECPLRQRIMPLALRSWFFNVTQHGFFWNVWLTHLWLEMMFREVPETDLAPIFA